MKLPVLNINQFQSAEPLTDFYINRFSKHIEANKELVFRPHKHNFYLCVFFTKGSGTHEIDFKSYEIAPGKVFFLRPGQTHSWQFDTKPEGFIIFHSQEFYELNFLGHKLKDFPFYYSLQNPPVVNLPPQKLENFNLTIAQILTEYQQQKPFSKLKINSLLNLAYIDFSRIYALDPLIDMKISPRHPTFLENLEALINENFIQEKSPNYYANRLFITTKHLNRMVKKSLNKTTSQLISERIVLEAKRLMVYADGSLSDIGRQLEFSDYSHFSKFFKVQTGMTPSAFRKKYRMK